jgi:hypothetical protein
VIQHVRLRKLTPNDVRKLGIPNIHQESSECKQYGCVVHCWSDHHMRKWPLNWRDDAGKFERICSHGVGHPDPDGAGWAKRNGFEIALIHGCDRCCDPEHVKNLA